MNGPLLTLVPYAAARLSFMLNSPPPNTTAGANGSPVGFNGRLKVRDGSGVLVLDWSGLVHGTPLAGVNIGGKMSMRIEIDADDALLGAMALVDDAGASYELSCECGPPDTPEISLLTGPVHSTARSLRPVAVPVSCGCQSAAPCGCS